ncbi:MAG: hypothetical protein M3120_07930 [Pseudomonadota bacterium]|nr:hypothetical protein [Pseudomonadota bacterium]
MRYSEAHLLGAADEGIYLILEVLNVSRVANGFRSMALAQRAILDHPLVIKQFAARGCDLAKDSR